MAAQPILLRSFDRFAKVCEFDPLSGRVRWLGRRADDRLETAGFVKSFWFGPRLIVYQLGEVWHIRIGDEHYALDDRRLSFEARPKGMRTTLLVHTPSRSYRCIDYSPLDWFVSRVDPTYDGIDAAASDFPGWLAGLRGRSGGR